MLTLTSVLPARTPVTTPLSLTRAMAGSSETHTAVLELASRRE